MRCVFFGFMPVFSSVTRVRADLFIGLGDMIYADNACEAVGRYGNAQRRDVGLAIDLGSFRAKWRYVWSDPHFRVLTATTPYYGLWDDHEVVNDFSPAVDTRDTPPYSADVRLMPIGLRASSPIVRSR